MSNCEINWDNLLELVRRISEFGKENSLVPPLNEIELFRYYFDDEGILKHNELDDRDGKFTRREILSRYLLLGIVLDQGPDMKGVRELLKNVITQFYRNEIRVFHTPIDFFHELGISIDEIVKKHASIKEIRAEDWARDNDSNPEKYNLFFTQSPNGIVSTNQVLDFAIHRWGVPLCVPLLLEQDNKRRGEDSIQPLIDYIESFDSAEIMSQQIKDNNRYGMGSAVGDKACHLFAKLYISVFKLVTDNKSGDLGWTDLSYVAPLDSNAGRILFRTGFWLTWANLDDLIRWNVIQEDGKGDANYNIRVTNIRGRKTDCIPQKTEEFNSYKNFVINYWKIGKQPRKVDIQHIPTIIIQKLNDKGSDLTLANFDDGLMKIGTSFCRNHNRPECENCPINDLCLANNENQELIRDYTT